MGLVDLPTHAPKSKEGLIRLHASTVYSGDWRLRSGKMPCGFGPISRLVFSLGRLRQPILSTEFCGTVAALGPVASRFRIGDAVLGFPGTTMRCHAKQLAMPENAAIALKPANLTDAQATVQIARHVGAVVSTTSSTANLDLLRSLAAAHARVETGHKRGNVVITMIHSAS